MINSTEILALLDRERRQLARDGEVLEILPSVTRWRTSDGSHHSVIGSSLTEEDADAAIVQEIEHHRRLGIGFEWKLFGHDNPKDMLDRLRRHGFQIGPLEAVLVFDLNQAGDWIDATDISRVRRVDRLDQIPEFQQVLEDVFDRENEAVLRQLSAAIRSGSTHQRGYIAYVGTEPASVGRLYTHPESFFAGLYGGGTRPKFRGRGAYRAVVAARARDARAHGARYLLVDALPSSRPILERLGFEWLTDTWPCEWQA
jgi:GNAT superfamily N-acetyltransferase